MTSCSRQSDTPQLLIEREVKQALNKIGLKLNALSVPKLDEPHSLPGRLPIVDESMSRPTGMVGLSRRLAGVNPSGARADYVAGLLEVLLVDGAARESVSKADNARLMALKSELPSVNNADEKLVNVLDRILLAIERAQRAWRQAGGKPSTVELSEIRAHLHELVSYKGNEANRRLLIPDAYHAIGARVDLSGLVHAMVELIRMVESVLPELRSIRASSLPLEFSVASGRVRVTGHEDDVHAGQYALLIDLGGDDDYRDVGGLPQPGHVSIVIDLSGNDTVQWEAVPGPGSGVFGMSIWADAGGQDVYHGNMGLGAGLFGVGVLWDMAGDDSYRAIAMSGGAGAYGVGVMLDEGGNDTYSASLYGQGFGGPGGIGMHVDMAGDDVYKCGGLVPDRTQERIARHEGKHYLSMCQGFGFGIRPQISGGAGILLDLQGNDRYVSDLFAQGSAYWFGLGMLVDRQGQDSYRAFEHCQGNALHLAAGFLGDWSGDDQYSGHEHCQGVGIDRAAGLLYDHGGNDDYRSVKFSQGAGIKPYGVGLFLEISGNDRYSAERDSQGIAFRPAGYPDSQWPVGMMLDLDGADTLNQPGVPDVYTGGRIQGWQGIAVDRSD